MLSSENADTKTFFTEVVGFSRAKEEEETSKALRFFQETHGLDFSSFKWGTTKEAKYATFHSFQSPLKPFASFNLVGKLDEEIDKTKCYPVTIGGYGVKFDQQQVLHGTYGGDKGISVNPGDVLDYHFYSIATSSDNPLVLQFQTTLPVRLEPVDGHTVADMEVFHDKLGSGRMYGVFRFVEKESDMHVTMRAVISFPSQ